MRGLFGVGDRCRGLARCHDGDDCVLLARPFNFPLSFFHADLHFLNQDLIILLVFWLLITFDVPDDLAKCLVKLMLMTMVVVEDCFT